MSDILGTPPDTHCWDDDSGKDCWSYSPRLVEKLLAAERNEIARLRGLLERAAVDLVRADNERAQIVAAERERWNKSLRLAGWFYELPSAMSYRLWEQGHEDEPDMVALYERA